MAEMFASLGNFPIQLAILAARRSHLGGSQIGQKDRDRVVIGAGLRDDERL